MNSYGNRSRPNSGTAAYDQWLREQEVTNSALTKMQRQFWVTKQTVKRKLGRKEDECVVASDSELDAKLELFRSIQQSCADLQRIIERYQEKLCNVSQEENAMGRFLKESGRTDKTRAGKIMTTAGKSLSYCGQQRLTLRMPLLRLHQEVETFRRRAIEDTQQNLAAMERSRTEYRASLAWMKEVSQQLDPDTNKQMDSFRKVQTQVRRSKARFDKQKLDCLQKVDLLAASRCNMFSHALVLYQNQLRTFAQNAAKTFNTIAASFSGYQHFEFSVVKELAEPSLKLAEETGQPGAAEHDTDQLLFFESEFKDSEESLTKPSSQKTENTSQDDSDLQEVLLDLGPADTMTPASMSEGDQQLLDEIFNTPMNGGGEGFGAEWQAMFGDTVLPTSPLQKEEEATDSFLPSKLFESWAQQHQQVAGSADLLLDGLSCLNLEQPSNPQPAAIHNNPSSSSKLPKGKVTGDMSAWFNVFADLDPLANPDKIGRQPAQLEEQRNC